MPPAATRKFPGVCARCGQTIPTGARFTWGARKRIFHADACPVGSSETQSETQSETFSYDVPKTETERVPETGIETAHGIGDIIEAAILKSVQNAASASALDAIRSEVESLRSLVTASKPLSIRVEREGSEPVTIDGAHASMPRLIDRIQRRKNVYLYGLPGSGKSTAARMAATALGLEYGYISLNPQTPDNRLLGFMDLNPGGDAPIYRETVFFRCYTKGGVFCIDELDNASASLLTTLNGMIENGHGAFPCGVLPRHKDFVLVATGNTAGRGGDVMFPERRAFDAAFSERFCFIRWEYDLALEEALTIGRNQKAGAWLQWVRDVRAFCLKERIRQFFSPRCSFTGAELLMDKGNAISDVAEEIGFRGLSEDLKARILAAHPLPSVSMSL
jgi:hypothetical protein